MLKIGLSGRARGLYAGLLAFGVLSQSMVAIAQVCSTMGVQNIAVLMVTFPGVALPAGVTPLSVHDTFFGTTGHSLDGYWREASYGKTSAAGDVYGTYTLSQSYTCSTVSQMRGEAMAMAAAQGANFQNYTRIFLIYPKIGCLAGFAQVGCSTLSTPSGPITASWASMEADYVNGDQGVGLASHEGGHNLGLQHAGTMGFVTEPLGPLSATGTISEFGDYWSTMGSQTLGHYSAQHKAQLGWLTPTNYQVVQSNGVWSLQPLETSPAGLVALQIQRGAGNNSWLWLEYRQPVGYDAGLMTQPFGGALIHYQDSTTGAATRLLDFTPDGAWNTWWETALLAGRTWVDPYSNVSISVQSATANALTVNVTYGPVVCTPGNPRVTISPANPSLLAGSSVNYTVSVTNTDSPACSANTFNLSTSLPAGWTTAFSAPTLTLNPGQSGSVTLTENAPLTALGTYAVNATATSGALTGTAAASASVTAPPPPTLSATLSIPQSNYNPKQTVAMTAMLSGSGAAGASVTFNLKKPDGTNTTKKARADSTGKASWSYNLGPKDLRGAYSALADATSSSATALSNTVGFEIQ